MASRIFLRRSPIFVGTGLKAQAPRRGLAISTQRVQDDDDVVSKQRSTPSASSAYRTRFNDMFPPLARGATLMNMLDMVDDILGNQASKPVPRPFQGSNRTAWDAMEDEKAFKLRLDMPGLSKDEVKVDVEDGNITIKGQKKEGEDEWSSRSTGSYDIKIKLPDNVKIEAIKAEMKHGVLRITAPKMEETKKKVVVSVN